MGNYNLKCILKNLPQYFTYFSKIRSYLIYPSLHENPLGTELLSSNSEMQKLSVIESALIFCYLSCFIFIVAFKISLVPIHTQFQNSPQSNNHHFMKFFSC
jgi:hypothetical protein